MSMYDTEAEKVLEQWATSKYAVLEVDVSSAHTDEDLANIATHYPSGNAFSWDEFSTEGIIFITDLRHSVDFELKKDSTSNDAAMFFTDGQSWERVGASSLYITHTATNATTVIILLEGY